YLVEDLSQRHAEARHDILAVEHAVLADQLRRRIRTKDDRGRAIGVDHPDKTRASAKVVVRLLHQFVGAVRRGENLHCQIPRSGEEASRPAIWGYTVGAHECQVWHTDRIRLRTKTIAAAFAATVAQAILHDVAAEDDGQTYGYAAGEPCRRTHDDQLAPHEL